MEEKVYICICENYWGEGETLSDAFDSLSAEYKSNEYEEVDVTECEFYKAQKLQVEVAKTFTIIDKK